MKKTILLTLCTLSLMANPYESNNEAYNAVVKTGQEVSTTLLKTLGKNLKQHMKSGGPIAAAKFCNSDAYSLTLQVDKSFGKEISVKRISSKTRNSANQAVGNEKQVLASLEGLNQAGVILPPFVVERVTTDTYKFYKPLLINKQVCLKCHGNISKNPKLASFLQEAYPQDKATGYSMGDLRGLIVVTIKK